MSIRRSITPCLAVVLALAAIGVAAAPAVAASPCWRTVINDWYRKNYLNK